MGLPERTPRGPGRPPADALHRAGGPGGALTAFIVTRIHVGDYEAWRPSFDQDRPAAREKATAQRVLRDVDDPNHVFVFLEFASIEDAQEARRRLLDSGVLDRFADVHGPNVVVDADG